MLNMLFLHSVCTHVKKIVERYVLYLIQCIVIQVFILGTYVLDMKLQLYDLHNYAIGFPKKR